MKLLGRLSVCSFAASVIACDSCYGPQDGIVHTRQVHPIAPRFDELNKRMQPDAQNASYGPTHGPLAWGQLNVIHTTDTHGWLEGHVLEKNYGADWGDFVSFTKAMKNKADHYGVDLLIVDTGDLHDGAGLSDATTPNGVLSNPIFDNIDYDLLTIGNHELYVTDVAYEHFLNFSQHWGEKYLTSNVQIKNRTSGNWQYIGRQYRYFTTTNGLRIMAFGVLFDFTGATGAAKVINATDVVKQQWWKQAVSGKPDNRATALPIDLFLLIGHNPVRWNDSESSMKTYYQSIRGMQPDIPIQVFGGHSHIRDFAVYDEMTTALESGRYCETLGWLSMSGLNSSNYTGATEPAGTLHPSHLALSGKNTNNPHASNAGATLRYSRRYLDWNRLTFEYHATGSQISSQFDYYSGERVSDNVTATRKILGIEKFLGCAPRTWCLSCAPYGSQENIFSGLVPDALKAGVVNQTRANIPRILIVNAGGIRFDLVKGPFLVDDSYIVSPFNDVFVYIPGVPYSVASRVLHVLNTNPAYQKRDLGAEGRELSVRDFGFSPVINDRCETPHIDPLLEGTSAVIKRSLGARKQQKINLTPGYTTVDDFGSYGDDTLHSHIPDYVNTIPSYIGSNASLPQNPSSNLKVDLVFIDYIAIDVLPVLAGLGHNYTEKDVSYYINDTFSTNTYLKVYAQQVWKGNISDCPSGVGVGGDIGT